MHQYMCMFTIFCQSVLEVDSAVSAMTTAASERCGLSIGSLSLVALTYASVNELAKLKGIISNRKDRASYKFITCLCIKAAIAAVGTATPDAQACQKSGQARHSLKSIETP